MDVSFTKQLAMNGKLFMGKIHVQNRNIIIIIIDKTDAGLNGLCIRDITLIYDVINTYNNY